VKRSPVAASIAGPSTALPGNSLARDAVTPLVTKSNRRAKAPGIGQPMPKSLKSPHFRGKHHTVESSYIPSTLPQRL
jgi:hypothetical protein